MHRVRALPPEKPLVRVRLEFAAVEDEAAVSRFCLVLHQLLEQRRKASRI